jgi:hypothetical protein
VTRRVFIHVGLPKTGTSYLQAVLSANKQRLTTGGKMLFPGRRWQDQVAAARDILASTRSGRPEGAWAAICEELAGWSDDAVISMEWLCAVETEQARRMVEELHPAEVEIIVTVRDFARMIPAAWQEWVQNRGVDTWPQFLDAVTSENPRGTAAGNSFWRKHDLGRVLTVWRDVVPAERIHVVTVPPSGSTPGELWRRFATVLGLEPALYDTTGRGANESLGIESAELMRRLNEVWRLRNLDDELYDGPVKHGLAKRGLSMRRHKEHGLRMPSRLDGWVSERTKEMEAVIVTTGVKLMGTLDDLQPASRPSSARDTVEPTSEELLDVALDGLVALAADSAEKVKRLHARRDTLEGQVARLRERNETERKELRRRLDELAAANEALRERDAFMSAHPFLAAAASTPLYRNRGPRVRHAIRRLAGRGG